MCDYDRLRYDDRDRPGTATTGAQVPRKPASILQDDKRLPSVADPEPQLFEAFSLNNMKLERSLYLPRLDAMTFSALMMTPVFYKIIVTTALSEGVQMGTYPKMLLCSPL